MVKIYSVTLSKEEQEYLSKQIEFRNSKSVIVKRSFVILSSDENGDKSWSDARISSTYSVSLRTIERLRKRFVEEGLQIALQGKPREIFKEKIFDGPIKSQLLALRCGKAPSGHSGWTLRLLADKMVELEYVDSISHESVRQILKKNEIKP